MYIHTCNVETNKQKRYLYLYNIAISTYWKHIGRLNPRPAKTDPIICQNHPWDAHVLHFGPHGSTEQ